MKPLLPFCRRVAVPEQRCSQHPAGTAAPRAPLPAPCQQLFSKTQTCFAMRPHPQPPSTASACLLPPSRHPLLCLWEGGVVRAVQSPLCNPTVARRATHFRNFPLFAAPPHRISLLRPPAHRTTPLFCSPLLFLQPPSLAPPVRSPEEPPQEGVRALHPLLGLGHQLHGLPLLPRAVHRGSAQPGPEPPPLPPPPLPPPGTRTEAGHGPYCTMRARSARPRAAQRALQVMRTKTTPAEGMRWMHLAGRTGCSRATMPTLRANEEWVVGFSPWPKPRVSLQLPSISE